MVQTHSGFQLKAGENITMPGTETVDGVDVSAHDVATTGVHGAGAANLITDAGVDTKITTHTADLDAHTKSWYELLRTGEYMLPSFEGSYGVSQVAMVANTLYAVPFLVARNMTVDRIAINCIASASSSAIRLGIYNDGTNLYPGTLLLDAGTIATDSTGVKAITISQALTKGLYWLVMVGNGTPTMRVCAGTFTFLGIGATHVTPQVQWSVAFTYDVLPASFTAGGTLGSLGNLSGWAICPRLLTLD